MKTKKYILMILIPLSVLLTLYYGYTTLDSYLQFQITTGKVVFENYSEMIISIQNKIILIFKWFGPILSLICLYGILKWLKKNE